jgi:hypothetical protein
LHQDEWQSVDLKFTNKLVGLFPFANTVPDKRHGPEIPAGTRIALPGAKEAVSPGIST